MCNLERLLYLVGPVKRTEGTQVPRQMAQGRGARDVACGHRTMAGGQRPLIGINRSVTRACNARYDRSPDLASTVCTRPGDETVSKSCARAATHGEEK